MRKFLWILTITGSVISGLILLSGVLAANRASQPAGPPAAAPAECDCSHLKVLRIELRNAISLQQAFRNKITDLRKMNKGESTIAVKQFAEGEARRGLERIPNYKGPSQVDYYPWGRTLYAGADLSKHTAEELCGRAASATAELNAAVAASDCAGIGKALHAHEDVHLNFCRTIGFANYEAMHGADRAQEEVEAYGAQIKVLRDVIDSLGCGYRATGQDGPVVYSGVICSLEKPFKVTGTHPLFTFPFEFVPSSATTGMMTYGTSGSGISAAGGGPYSIEGADTDTPRIVVKSQSTASIPTARTSGGGMATINLVPLETGECQISQPH